jgi:uncharacterized protein YqeY
MSLAKQIQADMKAAMKERKELKLSVLRMLYSAIKNKQIELKTEDLKDDDAVSVVKSEIKKRKDSVMAYKEGNRQDLAEKEEKEIEILKVYQPAQLDESVIEAKTKEVIDSLGEVGMQDFGRVMGAVMKELKGQVDGTIVNGIVKKLLADK